MFNFCGSVQLPLWYLTIFFPKYKMEITLKKDKKLVLKDVKIKSHPGRLMHQVGL